MHDATAAPRDFVPSFQLYGEQQGHGFPDFIHVETLKDRSQLHDWEIKPHRHFGLVQVMHFVTTEVLIDLDGQMFRTEEPSILFVPPSVVHGFEFSPNVVGSVTTIPLELLQDANGGQPFLPRQPGLVVAPGPGFGQCSQILAEMNREFHGRQFGRDAALQALVLLLMTLLQRHAQCTIVPASNDRGGKAAEQRLNIFLDLVEQRFTSIWGTTDYAAEIGVSKGQLTRDCRLLLGRSPLQVVHDRLIKEANRKLAYTLWPVGQISDALGFSDIGYFSRFYRQRMGKSPTAYRAQIQSRIDLCRFDNLKQ